jgi:hypothetical protein
MADLPPLPPGYAVEPATPDLPPGYTLAPAADTAAPAGPQQVSGLWRYPAMGASALAKGALQGAGAIGDLQDFIGRQFDQGIYAPLHRAVTGTNPPWMQQQVPPEAAWMAAPPPDPNNSPFNSAHLLAPARAVGAVDRPDLAPQNTGEKLFTAGGEAVGAAGPLIAAGGAGVPAMLRQVVQAAGSGVAGEGAAELFPNHPTLARLAGALLGAGVGGKVFDAGNRIAGSVAGSTSPTVQAYRNLGMSPDLAGDVTGNPALQMAQAYASRAPGGAGRIAAKSEQAIGQWGNALEDTAANLGNAKTLQEAGEAVQQNARAWLKQFGREGQRAWGNVDLQIPSTTPVALPNYAQTLMRVRTGCRTRPRPRQRWSRR